MLSIVIVNYVVALGSTCCMSNKLLYIETYLFVFFRLIRLKKYESISTVHPVRSVSSLVDLAALIAAREVNSKIALFILFS